MASRGALTTPNCNSRIPQINMTRPKSVSRLFGALLGRNIVESMVVSKCMLFGKSQMKQL